MNPETLNSSSLNGSPRCQHRTRTGRRYRHSALDASAGLPAVAGLCSRHAKSRQKYRQEADLTAALTGQLTELSSAWDINQVLSKLFILLSQDRISARRAAVLAYIGNLLLRTLPAIDLENNSLSAEDTAALILRNVPLPHRDEHPMRCASPACPGPLGESHRDEPPKVP